MQFCVFIHVTYIYISAHNMLTYCFLLYDCETDYICLDKHHGLYSYNLTVSASYYVTRDTLNHTCSS